MSQILCSTYSSLAFSNLIGILKTRSITIMLYMRLEVLILFRADLLKSEECYKLFFRQDVEPLASRSEAFDVTFYFKQGHAKPFAINHIINNLFVNLLLVHKLSLRKHSMQWRIIKLFLIFVYLKLYLSYFSFDSLNNKTQYSAQSLGFSKQLCELEIKITKIFMLSIIIFSN